MKNWSCPKKQAARVETILANGPVVEQYWSMAGLSTTPGCEVDQILNAGFIRPEQFHGVEINRDIYDANVAAWPNLAWHHGDFFQVMHQYPYLLQTRIGPIEIAPEDTWVACVWSDLDRAKEAIRNDRLNRYCGKWNHLYADMMFKSRQMAQAAVDDFFCELAIFLPAA